MWRLLKHHISYFLNINISKIIIIFIGIIAYELNELFYFYDSFDIEFALVISNSGLLGIAISENNFTVVRQSKLIPIKRYKVFITRQLIVSLPFIISYIIFELYFYNFKTLDDEMFTDVFGLSKFYLIITIAMLSIFDLLNTSSKFKYILLIFVPALVVIGYFVVIFFLMNNLLARNLSDILMFELLFILGFVLTNIILYYFFKNKSDFLK